MALVAKENYAKWSARQGSGSRGKYRGGGRSGGGGRGREDGGTDGGGGTDGNDSRSCFARGKPGHLIRD